MGDEASSRTATPDEVDQMAALVREAMDAGAAGFATSFAITHLGADGKPIPSRWADRAELDALFQAAGRQRPRRRRDQRRQRRAALRPDLRPAARARHPRHLHRAAHQLDRQPPQGAGACTARAWTKGSAVWPQVSPPAADVLDDHGRAVHAQHQPGVRRADGRHARRARQGLRRPGVAPAGARRVGVRAAGRLPPRWETYEIMESTANPELRRPPHARASPPSAAPTRSTCCSTSPSPSRR